MPKDLIISKFPEVRMETVLYLIEPIGRKIIGSTFCSLRNYKPQYHVAQCSAEYNNYTCFMEKGGYDLACK